MRLSMVRRSFLFIVFLYSALLPAVEVEVIHWWTSKSEQQAVSILAEQFNKLGDDKWIDAAIAQGKNARSVTIQRILGGRPPAMAQFNISRQFEELIEEDLLVDLTPLAEQEGWHDFVRPVSLLSSCMKDGRIYCVPMNIHTNNLLWTNKSIFAEAGVAEPTTWEELLTVAPKIRAAGHIPLTLGGESWQETLVFYVVLLGADDTTLWEKVFRDRDMNAIGSEAMFNVFETLGELKQYVDEGSPGRNWNDATNMVITGNAAMQLMGDWARGEFLAAGKEAGKDYGCIIGPALSPSLLVGGDAFVFPKQKNKEVEAAQFRMASLLLTAEVQAKFNSAKGSLPVRGDVDLPSADACVQKGMALLEQEGAVSNHMEIYLDSDSTGEIMDLVSTFWNTPSMSAKAAHKRFINILKYAE